MIVIFVSQCEKNALKRTRRVLDAFANRIGNNTWQTVITEEGLLTVKKMLRQTASKSTAVSCHWIRSRARSDLLWIIGNRNQFNEMGYVAVNSTEQDLLKSELENDWHYLPVIKSITKIAALLHDWGKSTVRFQKKLANAISQTRKKEPKGDPIRHEFISCLLFTAFVRQSLESQEDNGDKAWIEALLAGQLHEKSLQKDLKNDGRPFQNLPDTASLIIWLILSHHKLPLLKEDSARGQNHSIQDLLGKIDAKWGYDNQIRSGKESATEIEKLDKWLNECFKFEPKKGLVTQSKPWLNELNSAARQLDQQLPLLKQAFQDGSWRVIAHHARLCLMLGDHYYSSKEKDSTWQPAVQLIANTGKNEGKTLQKQYLDEHLQHVARHAVEAVEHLPEIHSELNYAYDIDALMPQKNAPEKFQWQDNAVKNIQYWRKAREDITENSIQTGVFIVNMASTGCGKTLANAKIMQALSPDQQSLRFILALGLRTLTLQTGDEYRQRAGLSDDEMAVMIGSKAVQDLHKQARHEQALHEQKNTESTSQSVQSNTLHQAEDINDDLNESIHDSNYGSSSAETLLDDQEELNWSGMLPDEILSTVLPKVRERQLLYAPVLVCTIDHIMGATETKRGGRYILPSLRLFSSDLVIDEVDDFTGSDLIAIGRLIYLAGMLGRKVMISSATIPPDLALGFFNAYQKGWQLYAISHKKSAQVACMWFDENPQPKKSDIQLVACGQTAPQAYQLFHQDFIEQRIKCLTKKLVKQRAKIIRCGTENIPSRTKESYFSVIKGSIIEFHSSNCSVDSLTNIMVSFGVVRMANITPSIQLTQYLMNIDFPDEFEIRIMPYHSQQVLLLRHEQEKHLDSVLNRKGDNNPLKNKTVREHLSHIKQESPQAKHLIFILVATPVEEVGRDHDFDWAIVEPSSMRSIIQLAGRVRRHRDDQIEHSNIGILQYNLKGFLEDPKHKKPERPVFQYPGYEESTDNYLLNSHDLCQLINEETELTNGITAIPRIQKPTKLNPKDNLIDLEHYSTRNTLDIPIILGEKLKYTSSTNPRTMYNKEHIDINEYLPTQLLGFTSYYWWMTGIPQAKTPFRGNKNSIKSYMVNYDDNTKFYVFDKKHGWIDRTSILKIKKIELTTTEKMRLWLCRDYTKLIEKKMASYNNIATINKDLITKKFGEIVFSYRKNSSFGYGYCDNFGIFIDE